MVEAPGRAAVVMGTRGKRSETAADRKKNPAIPVRGEIVEHGMFRDREYRGPAVSRMAKIDDKRRFPSGLPKSFCVADLPFWQQYVEEQERNEQHEILLGREMRARTIQQARAVELKAARRELEEVKVLLYEIAAPAGGIVERAASHAAQLGLHIGRYQAYSSPSSRFGTGTRRPQLTKENIRRVLERFSTKSDAAAELEIDPRYLRKLCKRFGIR